MFRKFSVKAVCLLMVLSMTGVLFASCGSNAASVEDVVPRAKVTLAIYLVTDASTTPDAIAAVEDRLNFITEYAFSTRVKLIAVTADKYEAMVQAGFDAYNNRLEKAAEDASIKKESERISKSISASEKKAGITTASTKATKAPKTEATTTAEPQFPELGENQMDLILITSSSMYSKYAADGLLESLDSDLSITYKNIKNYIFPTLMEGAKYNGTTYAIPSNKAIGEATFLAIDNALAEKYGLDVSKVKTVEDIMGFLRDVKSGETAVAPFSEYLGMDKYYTTLFDEYPELPVMAIAAQTRVFTPETVTETVDSDDPTNVTITKTPYSLNTVSDAFSFVNVLESTNFLNLCAVNHKLRAYGLVSSGASNYAAFFKTGTFEEMESWKAEEDDAYTYIVYKNPVATVEEIQSSMFAIPKSTVNMARAWEVLNLMTTGPEFKTLFQYGIEDVHYIYNEDGQIERLNNDYVMKNEYTGNSYLTPTLAGEPMDKWAIAQQQNLTLVQSLFFDKSLDTSVITSETRSLMQEVNNVTRQHLNTLLQGTLSYTPATIGPDDDPETFDPYAEVWTEYEAYVQNTLLPAINGPAPDPIYDEEGNEIAPEEPYVTKMNQLLTALREMIPATS